MSIQRVTLLSKHQSVNKSCYFHSKADVRNSTFGKNVAIFNSVIMADSTIGSYSIVQKFTTIFNASIGKFCSIGPNVSIGPGIHETNRVSTHTSLYIYGAPLPKIFATRVVYETLSKVVLKNDVWIGEGAIILGGITIGTGAVVAAGAIVVKDVEPYSIVGGIPARHIKYRFNEEIISVLLESEWWDKDEDWIQKNVDSFKNISEFMILLKKRYEKENSSF